MSGSHNSSLCDGNIITRDQGEKIEPFEKCNICKRETPYDYLCSQCGKIFCSNCLRTYRGAHWTDELYICNKCNVPNGYFTGIIRS